MNPLIAIIIGAVIIIIGYILATSRREINFEQDIIYLHRLIKKIPVTEENYFEIKIQYDMLEPMNERQRKEKKHLFAEIQHKFEEVSPLTVKQ